MRHRRICLLLFYLLQGRVVMQLCQHYLLGLLRPSLQLRFSHRPRVCPPLWASLSQQQLPWLTLCGRSTAPLSLGDPFWPVELLHNHHPDCTFQCLPLRTLSLGPLSKANRFPLKSYHLLLYTSLQGLLCRAHCRPFSKHCRLLRRFRHRQVKHRRHLFKRRQRRTNRKLCSLRRRLRRLVWGLAKHKIADPSTCRALKGMPMILMRTKMASTPTVAAQDPAGVGAGAEQEPTGKDKAGMLIRRRMTQRMDTPLTVSVPNFTVGLYLELKNTTLERRIRTLASGSGNLKMRSIEAIIPTRREGITATVFSGCQTT